MRPTATDVARSVVCVSVYLTVDQTDVRCWGQGRIKASAGPGAVPNAGLLQTYNQLTTPTNCGPPKLRPPKCGTVWGADSCGSKKPCILDMSQDRTNPFAAVMGDNTAMRPFAKLL